MIQGLESRGADLGDVRFEADVPNGVVNIRIRPPLALESGRVTVPFALADLQDVVAQLTLEMNKHARALMRELAHGSHGSGR